MSDPQTETPSQAPTTTQSPTANQADSNEDPSGLRCDFCGRTVTRVRRVALDGGYDRLQVRHQERYACSDCSEQKQRQRVEHGNG